MIGIFTDGQSLALLGLVTGGAIAAYGAGVWFLSILHGRGRDAAALPVAPFFVAVTTIWALIFGFVASEIWSTNVRAGEAAQHERATLQRLGGMAEVEALDLADVRRALNAYVRAVAEQEWGRDANRAPVPAADDAVQDIRLGLVAADAAGVSAPLMSKMIHDFDELQDARATRLAIGKGIVRELKWVLVVVLGLLSLAAIAAVHRDRPRAGRLSLGIFTVAAAASIWLAALHATPYSGPIRFSEAQIMGLW